MRTLISAPARRAPALALLAILALAGCGPSPAVTVELADSTVVVILGGSASTDVTLTRLGGASADVTLDADGAPDWVSVSFAPATLTGGTLTSTLTLEADAQDPDAEPTSFTLTVTAVGSGLTASDEVTVDVELLKVTGRVVDAFGGPWTGAVVSVNGEAPVAVDLSGAFEGPEVTVPYDVTLIDATQGLAHAFVGLTTTDLSLQVLAATLASSAGVAGDLSEAVGTDQIGIVCVEGVEQALLGCDEVTSGNTSYSFQVSWLEGSSASGYVHAWVLDLDAGGGVVGFAKEGRTAVVLNDGMATPADVALEDGPAASVVDVTITPPPGIPFGSSIVAVRYGEFASFPLATFLPDATFQIALPDLPGATATVVGQAGDSSSTVIAWTPDDYSDGTIDLTMPAGLTPEGPADGATGVTLDTVFGVGNAQGRPLTFAFNGPVTYFVTTTASQTTIPDLAAFGLPLPSGENYTWEALTTAGIDSVDDAAHEGWARGLLQLQLTIAGGPGPDAPGSVSATASRGFTTD